MGTNGEAPRPGTTPMDYILLGTYLAPPFPKEHIERCLHFELRASDILLAGLPKAGNTWLEQIIWMIFHDGEEHEGSKLDMGKDFPLIDVNRPNSEVDVMTKLQQQTTPRMIDTHLPVQFFQDTIDNNKPKVVVIMRNIKDLLVSSFHFFNKVGSYNLTTFDQMFTLFKEDKMIFGPIVDHMLGWWNTYKDSPHVIFMTYEDLKADLPREISRLASFLQKNLSDEIILAIVEKSSFENQSQRAQLADAKGKADCPTAGDEGQRAASEGPAPGAGPSPTSSGVSSPMKPPKNTAFIRKGVVGDWKNVLSEEQSKYIDAVCEKRLAPVGLFLKDSL